MRVEVIKMKKTIMVALMVLFLATGCARIPQLANGEEAVVAFDNMDLAISANDLYNALKDRFALSVLIDMIDWNILTAEYPNDEENADLYVEEELEKIKANFLDDNGRYDEQALLDALMEVYRIDSIEIFEDMLRLAYYRNKAVDDHAKEQITKRQIEDHYKN